MVNMAGGAGAHQVMGPPSQNNPQHKSPTQALQQLLQTLKNPSTPSQQNEVGGESLLLKPKGFDCVGKFSVLVCCNSIFHF